MPRRPEEGRVGGGVCGLKGAAHRMDLCEAGGSVLGGRGLWGGAWSPGTLGAGWPGTSGCSSGNWVIGGSFSLRRGTA